MTIDSGSKSASKGARVNRRVVHVGGTHCKACFRCEDEGRMDEEFFLMRVKEGGCVCAGERWDGDMSVQEQKKNGCATSPYMRMSEQAKIAIERGVLG